jgi:hypothetical protein
MPWPTSQIADGSAAAIWNQLCANALQAKRNVTAYRLRAQQGQLTPADLRVLVPQLRAARALLNQHDGSNEVQAYARLVSGDAAFSLSAESGLLKAALATAIGEGRTLHNAARGDLAADGTVTEPLAVIPADIAAPFIAALQTLEAAISG